MILVDTADRAELSRALTAPYVKGFTTNPTLFLRALGAERLSVSEYVSAALDLVGFAANSATVRDFMIQGVGAPERILEQAQSYRAALGDRDDKKLWIKLPPTRDHLSLCPKLAALGCKTLITAVFTPAQALAAMECHADGVAVYLGRLMQRDDCWERKLESIANLVLTRERMLLMARLPDLARVETALLYSEDMTVAFAMVEQLLCSPFSREAVAAFDAQVTDV